MLVLLDAAAWSLAVLALLLFSAGVQLARDAPWWGSLGARRAEDTTDHPLEN